jgi:hypothetical protein
VEVWWKFDCFDPQNFIYIYKKALRDNLGVKILFSSLKSARATIFLTLSLIRSGLVIQGRGIRIRESRFGS